MAYAMEQIELARQSCKGPVVLFEQHLDYSVFLLATTTATVVISVSVTSESTVTSEWVTS